MNILFLLVLALVSLAPSWSATPDPVIGTRTVTPKVTTVFTAGSVPFASTNGILYQDNSKFFWDDSNFFLGIGTAAPGTFLDIVGTTEQARLRYDATHYSSFTVSAAGYLTIAPSGGAMFLTGGLIGSAYIQLAAASSFQWAGRSALYSLADGNLTVYNAANTDFGLVQFGGVTASFPAIKRSGAGIQVRLADDSGFGSLSSSSLTLSTSLSVPSTITTPGTTGNQTINKMSGRVNIAAGGSSITVTDSLVTTASIILCTIATDDTTAILKNCVPGTGSFVIKTTAAVTAETAISFLVIN